MDLGAGINLDMDRQRLEPVSPTRLMVVAIVQEAREQAFVRIENRGVAFLMPV